MKAHIQTLHMLFNQFKARHVLLKTSADKRPTSAQVARTRARSQTKEAEAETGSNYSRSEEHETDSLLQRKEQQLKQLMREIESLK
jgi:hypothetical protein